MRRTVHAVTLAVLLGAAPFAATQSFAFDVQSGGVPLSAQSVALLANRLTAQQKPTAQPGTAAGPTGIGATRDERMMEFMLGGKPGARPNTPADRLADLKAALKDRR